MCEISDCESRPTRRGLCQKHYMRAYRNGTLQENTRDTKCLVKDCFLAKNRYGLDYCSVHQLQIRRRGRIIIHETFDSCQWCGEDSDKKFCSNSCSGKYWRANNHELSISNSAARRARKKGALGSHTNEEWNLVKEKYGNKCLCCKEEKKLTRDHVVPLSLGGTDYIDNIQPLCKSCNMKKHVKVIDYRLEQ